MPYRCKKARRVKYHALEKEKMASYYANIPEDRKIFINERKKLRKRFNTGTITELEFNQQLIAAYELYQKNLLISQKKAIEAEQLRLAQEQAKRDEEIRIEQARRERERWLEEILSQ